jgi:hypothetical protein
MTTLLKSTMFSCKSASSSLPPTLPLLTGTFTIAVSSSINAIVSHYIPVSKQSHSKGPMLQLMITLLDLIHMALFHYSKQSLLSDINMYYQYHCFTHCLVKTCNSTKHCTVYHFFMFYKAQKDKCESKRECTSMWQ